MCCSTGVCGPDVDPEKVRFAADLLWLESNGVEVERFNLAQEPAAFVRNPIVAQAIRGRDDALPLLLVDGEIVAQGSYPTREVLARLAGMSANDVAAPQAAPKACCAPTHAAPVPLARPGTAPKKCC
jgi:hypothetical protein